MSTRCNVLISDKYSKQWFYRHSDGYPSCTAESLKTFIQWLVDGKIRDNVSQGASWLIILGNNECVEMSKESNGEYHYGGGTEPILEGFSGWKVGSYEITTEKHGDIEWLYNIDMHKKTVKISRPDGDEAKKYSYEEFLAEDFTE